MYVIRDREAGNTIITCPLYEQAVSLVTEFEKQDIADGSFVPSFYEIVEVSKNVN